jgi:osmotically-inducible protein OsmY
VATYDGEVMLNGFVNTQQDKMKAEYVVSKISGVKAVINDLVVRS